MAGDPTTIEASLRARRAGLTLRDCATVAGVHVATVCRWQARDPELRHSMTLAAEDARFDRHRWAPRPHIRWRGDCPLCKARVVVRSAAGKARFWRCGRWPLCPWAS